MEENTNVSLVAPQKESLNAPEKELLTLKSLCVVNMEPSTIVRTITSFSYQTARSEEDFKITLFKIGKCVIGINLNCMSMTMVNQLSKSPSKTSLTPNAANTLRVMLVAILTVTDFTLKKGFDRKPAAQRILRSVLLRKFQRRLPNTLKVSPLVNIFSRELKDLLSKSIETMTVAFPLAFFQQKFYLPTSENLKTALDVVSMYFERSALAVLEAISKETVKSK